MKAYQLNPLFVVGLAVKTLIVAFILPGPVIDWYLPFIESVHNFDPWGAWISGGGSSEVFPYGYAMLLPFIPLLNIVGLIGLPTYIGYGLTMILVDISLLYCIYKITKTTNFNLLLSVYWLSPIVILATYVLGFNDLIPVTLIVFALHAIKEKCFLRAGVLCTAAISAKLSMILAIPFFFIYFLHNKSIRRYTGDFLKGIFLASIILLLPFTFFPSGMIMTLSNPEIQKVYQLTLNLGQGLSIYLVPLIYMLLLYAFWGVRRLSFDLFNSILGLSLFSIVLMMPASPGWLIWAVPLLVFYQLSSDLIAIYLVTILSLLFVAENLIAPILIDGGTLDLITGYVNSPEILISLIHTSTIATGIILAVRIWRETINRNDFFRLSRKPFVIGIAGDSGAGKDTFSDAIKSLFGTHSVTTLSGDDYHLWDRRKPMWQVMTHLNPMANDLKRYVSNLVDLIDGKSIQTHHYDHSTGRMTRPFRVKSNDFIIASGLHALYIPILLDCYDLSIYLDIDEGLRRQFKIQRDVHQRGHTIEKVLSAFERREPDSEKFIRPQAKNADLIMSLQPIHPGMLDKKNNKHALRFKLTVRSRKGLDEMSLTRVLVGVCGLHVDVNVDKSTSEVAMTIEGENTAEDIALATQMIYPRLFEFFDTEPKWESGIMGVMQLITLSHINQALTKRFVI